ncbi:hypothetical protein RJT34_14906 [Clitoria ternatea]|uniref:DUF4408 domain-containing protein n=1 Tax=Clitoria ternatea TaxID=43366 RepID=A0AAN9JTD6_CLITE
MMSDAGGAVSIYSTMSSWLTPSCLFLFINLVIGTIAITSRCFANPSSEKTQHHSPVQLARSPSLLDRLASFNLRCYKHEPTSPVQTPQFDRVPSSSFEQEEPRRDPVEPSREEVKLERAPSLLERLRSLTLGRSESVKETEAEEREEEELGVDAKADDFINRFREQLRLQRRDSILRYRDMLKRN